MKNQKPMGCDVGAACGVGDLRRRALKGLNGIFIQTQALKATHSSDYPGGPQPSTGRFRPAENELGSIRAANSAAS